MGLTLQKIIKTAKLYLISLLNDSVISTFILYSILHFKNKWISEHLNPYYINKLAKLVNKYYYAHVLKYIVKS